jgi:peptidoglycan/xylan/chitin deacetylase (PgdA/CDA1 family)
MSAWLEPLRSVLDAAPGKATFFFRDDDAGWGDERLHALLGVFERHGLPLDLAVIPAALGSELARELEARVRSTPELLGVHQHGYAHCNHEGSARKCEFGDARSRAAQRRDLAAGAEILRSRFGRRVDPIFTPPWNRCNAATVECLAELDFRTLSRDRGAAPLERRGLSELPVDVDWCKRLAAEQPLEPLGRALAGAAGSGQPTGVMLHHAAMPESGLQPLEELLALLATHPASRCTLMRNLA